MKRRHSICPPAFTLIELILVLVLCSLMAAMVVPSMLRFTANQALGDTTDQFVTLARWARTQALAQGVNYRLNIDLAERTYWLTVQKGATYENALQSEVGQGAMPTPGGDQGQAPIPYDEVQEETGRRFTLGNGVTFTTAIVPQADGLYIEFRASGRSDQGTLTFTDATNRVVEIGTLSATEPFHVLSDNEKQMEIAQQSNPPPPAQSR